MSTLLAKPADKNKNTILSVSELNASTKQMLEENFNQVKVIGEVSNLAQPASGHLYFSLKDENAQIRCAMFRHANQRSNFKLKDGQLILANGKPTLYQARGDFQLIVSNVELTGDGALQIAFEKLKNKLAAEGLFDPAHKKPLPVFPKTIGVVSSASGAALRDILTVLQRRAPTIEVIIYPTLVQGEQAAPAIARAIEVANQRKECDALIVARGGGSLEDLWPFNEERVARAIFLSELPVISGVGHEIDFTIADFVADQRAATPSAAAELSSPKSSDWLQQMQHLLYRMQQCLLHQLAQKNQLLHSLTKRLRSPEQQLQMYQERLDEKNRRLSQALQYQCKQWQMQLSVLTEKLDTLSPLKTLARGYSIALKEDKIIRQADEVEVNDCITLRLSRGQLHCQITKKTT